MRRMILLLLCLSLLPIPTRGSDAPKYVALTFDDGPSGRYTRRLLDGLQQRQVHATFFLCGYRLKDYPEDAQRIFDEGHEIGIHGYSHKNMKGMSRRDIAQEIVDTRDLLPAGCKPVWLRPPGGCCSDAVRQVAECKNLAILGWSVDPMDWNTGSIEAICQAVVEKVRDGDIILLHDMSDSSVAAALAIIDILEKRGYEFVTASELVKLRGEKLRQGESYRRFPAP